KSLDKLMGSQITDNNKTGLGFTSYNAVVPPPTGLFAPPTIDLSSFDLEEFKQPEFKSYGPKANWVSNCDEDESEEVVVKSENVQHKPKLGVGFQFSKKACFVCGSFCHLIKDCDFHDKNMIQKHVLKTVKKGYDTREVRAVWNHAMRVNHQNFSNSRRNFIPTAVLTKSGIVPISTARQSSSRVAAPVSTARPINTVTPKPIETSPFSQTIKNIMEDLLLLQAVLKEVPRKNNMYSFNLKNIIPSKGLTCLFAKATNDESNLWHRRLGHINFKTMNKLVKGNLVRGIPLKIFKNDHTCITCQKGKQHKASCKSKLVNNVSQPLQILHMDLFVPAFIKSIMGKMYYLVVTDDYSRFSWVFFLTKKDETCGILKDFIAGIENQLNYKVKIIRCDNGTEFKNYEMNQFCGIKGIKRESSNARTPQQNRVVERKNRTLIEVARTMLADSLLPIPF
nr:putative ribonuclease H-like domain-containing protein [Tanacetum cinerariifolium]